MTLPPEAYAAALTTLPDAGPARLCALLDGADLREVYADTVRETMTTYAQEVPA